MNLRTTLVSLSLVLAAGANAQVLPHQWNLVDGRTIDVQFAANGLLPRPDLAAVNRAPTNPEPDPTAMDGMFTFGDSVIRALEAWNHANGANGWRLNLIPPGAMPANPLITVQLDQFTFPIAPPPHAGGSADAIALFVPGATNGDGKLLDAKILFNVRPGVDWGIGNNQMDGTDNDFKFDPINVMIHEFGHAFRLDHPMGGGTLTRANSAASSAMLPLTDAGVHRLNPNANYNRYPHAADIAAAAGTLPAPGAVALAGLGATLVGVRRRR
ncbi:MAG: hypothetical protein HBSAPP03_00020 [Phycisphaerae bacterium]|nr:MAG: hypothetical protein HBSAPP03_00020 [Phycisphaerae bacterium]